MERFADVELSKLKKAPWNYKIQDEDLKEKLMQNLTRNGVLENIVIRDLGDGTFEVVNGNHRLDVLLELKHEKVICCNLGKISEAEAKRIAVELNETHFDNDQVELSKVIDHIAQEFGVDDIVRTLPFTDLEIENMRDSLRFDWTENKDPGKKGKGKNTESILCTKEQLAIIKQAIAALKENEDYKDMPDGRCLELICADYLSGRKL